MLKKKILTTLLSCLFLLFTACAGDRTQIAVYPSPGVVAYPSGKTVLGIESDDFHLKGKLENRGVKLWRENFTQPVIPETDLLPPDSGLNQQQKLARFKSFPGIDRYLVGHVINREVEYETGYYTNWDLYSFSVPYTYTIEHQTYSFDLIDIRTGKVLWHAVVATEGRESEQMGKSILKRMVESLAQSGLVTTKKSQK